MSGDGVPTANCAAVRSAAGISGSISSTKLVSICSRAVGDREIGTLSLCEEDPIWLGIQAPAQMLRIRPRGPTHLDQTTLVLLVPLIPNIVVVRVA